MQNSTCNKGIFRETPQQLPKLEETHLHVDKICNPKNCLPFLCFKMLYSIYGNDMEIIVVLVFITNKNCNILSTHFTFTSCMARPCQSNGNRKHWNQKTEIKRENRRKREYERENSCTYLARLLTRDRAVSMLWLRSSFSPLLHSTRIPPAATHCTAGTRRGSVYQDLWPQLNFPFKQIKN